MRTISQPLFAINLCGFSPPSTNPNLWVRFAPAHQPARANASGWRSRLRRFAGLLLVFAFAVPRCSLT